MDISIAASRSHFGTHKMHGLPERSREIMVKMRRACAHMSSRWRTWEPQRFVRLRKWRSCQSSTSSLRLSGPVEYRQATALVRVMLAVAAKYQHLTGAESIRLTPVEDLRPPVNVNRSCADTDTTHAIAAVSVHQEISIIKCQIEILIERH